MIERCNKLVILFAQAQTSHDEQRGNVFHTENSHFDIDAQQRLHFYQTPGINLWPI